MTNIKRLAKGDYVIGTNAAEIWRLGLQHTVWRSRASDAWRRGGFSIGQHILDVGCGPGYASLDLADIVGGSGTITAIDGSKIFLESLKTRIERASIRNVQTIEVDFDESQIAGMDADGAWCRWVFAFVTKPRDLLTQLATALKPGAKLIIHEYVAYQTWRVAPRSALFEEFVRLILSSWREHGGEPDIALDLVSWLPQAGFSIDELRTIVDVVDPTNFVWQWPSSFVESGLARLGELGRITPGHADEIRAAFHALEGNHDARMVTPAVLEIIATRIA